MPSRFHSVHMSKCACIVLTRLANFGLIGRSLRSALSFFGLNFKALCALCFLFFTLFMVILLLLFLNRIILRFLKPSLFVFVYPISIIEIIHFTLTLIISSWGAHGARTRGRRVACAH